MKLVEKISGNGKTNQTVVAVPATAFGDTPIADLPFADDRGKNIWLWLGAKATRAIDAVPAKQRDKTLADASAHQLRVGVPPRAKRETILYSESIKAVLPDPA